ncbi:hypothetical protein ACB092_12G132700 [Castanea dentata]
MLLPPFSASYFLFVPSLSFSFIHASYKTPCDSDRIFVVDTDSSLSLSLSLSRTPWFLSFVLPNRWCDVCPWLAMDLCGISGICKSWVSFLVVCSVWCGFPGRSEAHISGDWW